MVARVSMTLAEKLLSHPTDRDKQRKIGPSSIGQPCDFCVAADLRRTFSDAEPQRGQYWVGAAIGTAIHHYLEERLKLLFPEALPEQKIVIGELEGYGLIKGTTDGVLIDGEYDFWTVHGNTAVDWKTSTRDKMVWIRQAFLYPPEEGEAKKLQEARYKVQTYIGQVNLYARGLIAGGVPVENVLISFIPRDAKTSKDFFEVTVPVDVEYGQRVWDRLVRIYNNLDAEYESHPMCYPCNARY